jgi:HlyD family secretion protein
VLSKNVEPGEFVAAGTPIVTVGNLQDMWLRAYIPGTELGTVKLGQAVSLYTDSYPGKAYAGRVTFIAAESEFTPKTVQTNKERVKLVYRIKITIDNPNMELKPGMPADADINLTGGSSGAPSQRSTGISCGRSTGILPVSLTGVSPVSCSSLLPVHGRDARATHGRDAHAT